MTEHKTFKYLTCLNLDGRKHWLIKPLMDLNDSSVADGSVLGHGCSWRDQRQELSGGGAVLLLFLGGCLG